jgi:plastocyanin
MPLDSSADESYGRPRYRDKEAGMKRAAVVLAGLGVLVFAQLAFGGSDQAMTWNVAVGEQGRPPAGTPHGATLNQFFPGKLQINAGDKVTFTAFGFHTVSYLAGKPRPPLVGPAPGATYTGINDAAGQPFYFDGQQSFSYNPAVFGPLGPKTISGRTPASTGAIFATGPRKPAKATFTFPKVGKYKILCQVHPGMEMTVTVKPTGASVPSADDVAAKIKAETDVAWAKAKVLANAKVPAGTITMGIGGKTTILDFLPAVTRVKVGATVRFVNRAPSEPHNVGFGPLKYINKFMKQTDLFPMGPGSPNQVTPVFIYGSDPRGTTFDGTNHGNGFFATGLSDDQRGGLPNSQRVTFTAPGKYHFICMLHGKDMAADVIVTK